MKKCLMALLIGLAVSLIPGLFRASAELEVSAGISIHANADFYEPLAPGGTWVDGSYGRCWHPAGVAADWRPYSNGNWEWTDSGWYWVSDEPWAWACYHYGTWAYDSGEGWVWVPGVEWAPAWVNWRTGGDYVGWVPCSPPGFVIVPSFYIFVEGRNFRDRVRPETVITYNQNIYSHTAENGDTRRKGPRVDQIEKATGKNFAAVPVREADRQTSASIPEKFRHQAGQPANPQRPSPVEQQTKEQSNPAPERKLTPDKKQEMPDKQASPNREQQPPRETAPPDQSQTPRGNPNQGGNGQGNGNDKDKDHGGGPDMP